MTLTIPAELRFRDLKLTRDRVTDEVEFDTAPVLAVARASGLDIELLESEDTVAQILVAWYTIARQRGEPAHPIAEQLQREIAHEERQSSRALPS